jgi:hypothetical protein
LRFHQPFFFAEVFMLNCRVIAVAAARYARYAVDSGASLTSLTLLRAATAA